MLDNNALTINNNNLILKDKNKKWQKLNRSTT